MSRASDSLIGVIADDFTGALDAGVEFMRAGLETILALAPDTGHAAAVRVINADSRETDVATAQQRAAQAARQLAGRRIFKKIDSTMRGHVGAEIEAILDAAGIEKAVVCPAAIEAGRTVRDGRLFVHGGLLHETAFARDPFWPASTSDLARLVDRPCTHIAIETVRSGAIAQAIANAPARIVTADACTHDDLAAIGAAIGRGVLPCGALGLARAWAAQFTSSAPNTLAPTTQRPGGPILVVAGSRHPATAAQLDRLVAERAAISIEIAAASAGRQRWIDAIEAALSDGRPAVVRAPAELLGTASAQRALVETLGDLAAHVCETVALGGLVIVGGETASAVCQRLGAGGVRIRGQIEVGVPWSTIVGGRADGLPLVTKAGGFGNADTLTKAVDMLTG